MKKSYKQQNSCDLYIF